MKHIRIPPVGTPAGTGAVQPDGQDPRWQVLDLIRDARHQLELKDRDIAVLRGLLSLLPLANWGSQMTVFASNRVLATRCDGADERSLRRRLARLIDAGLIRRRQSPNGKRYQLRDTDGQVLLSYGFDLSPLQDMQPHLATLAEARHLEAMKAKTLRTLIRDRLYHLAQQHPLPCAPLLETARLSLRRKLPLADLEYLLARLDALLPSPATTVPSTTEMTASDSQTDRDIQRSDKEDIDLKRSHSENIADQHRTTNDLTLEECREATPTVQSLSPCPVRSWADIVRLAATLAPSIGLDPRCLRQAKAALGEIGAALAVLGLVEAFGRIRRPAAYLTALTERAEQQVLNPARMFRSLTRAPSSSA